MPTIARALIPTYLVTMQKPLISFKRHRFSPQINAHADWHWSDSDHQGLVLNEINAETLLTGTRALESIAPDLSKDITGPVAEVALAEK